MGLNVSSILFYFTRNRKYSTKSVTVGLHFSLFKACQPLANSSIFPGKRVVLELSLHFTTGQLSSVCILPPVCSLQCAFYADRSQIYLMPGSRKIFPVFPPKGSLKLVENKCRVAPCNRRNRFSNSLLYYYYFVSIPKTS